MTQSKKEIPKNGIGKTGI